MKKANDIWAQQCALFGHNDRGVTTMTTLVEQIKEWAMENYEKSFGASALIECWDDEMLANAFQSLEEAKDWASLQSEMYMNARCDM